MIEKFPADEQDGGLSATEAARGFAFGVLGAVASSAIRLHLCGQQAAHELMTFMGERVESQIERSLETEGREELWCHAPRLEISQEHPDQGGGRALIDDAGHEDVDLEAAKAPIRPVNRNDKVCFDGHQAQQHLRPGIEYR